MGYPLVPGYEAVGEVVEAYGGAAFKPGDSVFVPGAHCFTNARALFGASSKYVVASKDRVTKIDRQLDQAGVTFALAATAYHAIANGAAPDLIVGHGVFGRLLARLTRATGATAPTVWEVAPKRMSGGDGYRVVHPDEDARRDYASIYDASGDAGLLNQLIGRLTRGGEIVLAGFYPGQVSFAFAPAFMNEARFRIAAEWQPSDLDALVRLIDDQKLSLNNLVSHTAAVASPTAAYQTAFSDPGCIKMALDWRSTT
ncbi:UNVERIFIED_CONTAM: hypothetical protein GTU68_016352 [Idotea baltica]|nr:hypothetical protein [Idotea baltica]